MFVSCVCVCVCVYLLLLRSIQHFPGASEQLLLVLDLLLQHGHTRVQLVQLTLLIVALLVQSSILTTQRRHLLLRPLALLPTHTHTHTHTYTSDTE